MSEEHVIAGLRANAKQNKIWHKKEIEKLQAELDKLKEDKAGWLATYNAIKKANADLCMERGQLQAELKEFEQCEYPAMIEELQAELKALKKDGLKGNIPLAGLDQIVRMQEELDKHRWIPVGERLPPFTEHGTQSEWVRVTDGKVITNAYYYDYTKREQKPNYATGKGWYAHGIRRSEITHYQYITLPPENKDDK